MKKLSCFKRVLVVAVLVAYWVLPHAAQAQFVIEFTDADFVTNPQFSDVETFDFTLVVAEPLTTGLFNNPTLTSVDYGVSGDLDLVVGTPSGFSSFNLGRTISGTEFYGQGSSLNFEIAGTADLSDGLQASELVGSFILNAREINTGRYHPPLLEFDAAGAGTIQNSDNTGATAVNPSSGNLVDIDFGEEYITDLAFTPASFTIAISSVPEPSSSAIFLAAWVAVSIRRQRYNRC